MRVVLGLTDKQELERLQQIETQLLAAFDGLCREHGLRYFLSGGTLIGAVRHGGPVPWDDDADVMMPRPDYDRFNELCMHGDILPPHISIMHSEIVHIYDNRTLISAKHILGDTERYGVPLDVFPLDGYPSDRLRINIHYYRMLFCQLMIRLALITNIEPEDRRPPLYNLIIRVGKRLHTEKLIDKMKWVRRYEKIAYRYDYDSSELMSTSYSNGRKREIMPVAVMGEGCEVGYAGHRFVAPSDWDHYLKSLYGDYMTPPPEDRRQGHCMHLLRDDAPR